MPDNKLSSSSYTVSNISSTSSETKIIKRPYANIPFSSGKRQDKSNSFKDTLKSISSNNSSNEDSKDFSDLLSCELNNLKRLKSTENSRIVKSNFENNNLNNINSNKADSNIDSEKKSDILAEGKANTSELCKKVYLVNALRKEPNS